ncbi:uncharacterized protein [Gossypium hirsutum]|uniref:DNA/RNA polymerases superfamily protein n=1 Tax=Gossypium hirsutum TaxID=3635 RepID=A0ABM3AMQ3_GOSHI|nr:uncharacterized protein LOC121220752 [Gossypium hirsutum]
MSARAGSSASGHIPNVEAREAPASPVIETGSFDRVDGDDALSQAMLRILEGVAGTSTGAVGPMERIMDDLDCTSEQKLKSAVSLLRDEAYQWWLTGKYVGASYVDARRKEFLSLIQVNKNVVEYEAEFLRLSRYARGIVATEYERCLRFEDDLRDEFRVKIVEDLKHSKRQNREKDRGRFKRDSEPSSFSGRPKKKARCGSKEHQVKDCLQRPTQMQAAGQGFVQPPSPVYVARCREDGDAPDVITGSTHSYIACTVSGTLGIMCEITVNKMTVLSPLGQLVMVDKFVQRCAPRGSRSYVFSRFDGVTTIEDEEVAMIGERRDFLSNVISALRAEKLVRKGCEAFLAYVIVTDFEGPFVRDIRIVKDFFDVFPGELPRLPPNCEVKFGLELFLGMAPVSIAPYRMASNKANVLADALSRRVVSDLRAMFAHLSLFDDGSLLVELQVRSTWIEQIKGKQFLDESLVPRFCQVENGETSDFQLNSE